MGFELFEQTATQPREIYHAPIDERNNRKSCAEVQIDLLKEWNHLQRRCKLMKGRNELKNIFFMLDKNQLK